MGISPISGIHGLPVLKPRSPDADRSALSDIEQVTPIGDETYTPSEGNSASGADDDRDEPMDSPESQEPAQATTSPEQPSPGGAISFFA
jgi:hypothetical protein